MKRSSKIINLIMIVLLFVFIGCQSKPEAKVADENEVVKEVVVDDTPVVDEESIDADDNVLMTDDENEEEENVLSDVEDVDESEEE